MAHFHLHDAKSTPAMSKAVQLNNEANRMMKQGDYINAEKKHLEALALKVKATGGDSVHVANTRGALGELYMKMDRLEDAQKALEHADKIRSGMHSFLSR